MAILGPFDFRGGYSPGYDFTTLPQGKGYATIMDNCRIKSGYVVMRWAVTRVSDSSGLTGTAGPVLGLASWTDTANSKTAIVATCGSKLFIGDGTSFGPATTSIAFSDRTGALAAASLSGKTTFDSLNNILVGSSNSASTGAIFKVTAYNANGAALGGSPPSGDIVKQCNNFMFISRNLSSTTTQSKVYWSNVNDPETWTGTNVLDFNKNDGEPIMALGSIGTDLYIFKQSSIGRLSTVTITTSGAVTLGPLVTVIRGVGCCGPRALDNLPNGNIVFLGYNGHFYEFDGSSLVDRSDAGYPGHNVYDNGDFSVNYYNYGLAGNFPDTSVVVKTVRGMHEVWISYVTNGEHVYAYDYKENIWQGGRDFPGASSIKAYSMATMNLPANNYTNGIESTDFIIHGDGNLVSGAIWASGSAIAPYPNRDISTPTPVNARIGTVIQLPSQANGDPFIPRSLCFETSYTFSGGATLASLTVTVGYDTYIPSTFTPYTATASTVLPRRIVVPLTFAQDTIGTNVFPSIISILWTFQGQGTAPSTASSDILRLGKFWLSDEIIR